MKKWKVSNKKCIHNNKYLSFYEDEIKLDNGKEIKYYRFEKPNFVNVIALTKEEKFIMVKQYRHGAGIFSVEFPAGLVESGENPDEAMIRELKEETGYTSKSKIEKISEMYVNPTVINCTGTTYLLKDCILTDEQNLDESEEIEVLICTTDEIEQMINDNIINHPFVIATYYKYINKK